MKEKEPQFYTLEEAAKLLKVSIRSMYRYIHTNKIKASKIGYWRINKTDLKDFLDSVNNISSNDTNKKV